MDIQAKLELLGSAARFDISAADAKAPLEAPCAGLPDLHPYISHVQLPTGQCKPVLKVLQTSYCERNCHYCAFRAGRDVARASFAPEELAAAFDSMQRAAIVQGIFLSSAIAGSVRTMDQMIATAELLRRRHDYRGYVHLKILPNAEEAQIEQAVRLADRVSVNLEAPNPQRLELLAPRKEFGEGLMTPLRQAARAVARGHGRWTSLGISTQFVVGAVGESDIEILNTTQRLYDELHLARAYFSPFSPVPDTPLDGHPATPRARQYRLYQSDFLMRYYGFRAGEFVLDAAGSLALNQDPKLAWAQGHPERFPVEVNQAAKRILLRVPGIGPVSAQRIVEARRLGKLRELDDLGRLGVQTARAAPFVLINGRRPPLQLDLFHTATRY